MAVNHQIQDLAHTMCDRRRYVNSPICCKNMMTTGFNHAAMFFSHSHPFRATELWRESP